ncbi:MAG TPA: hypothetical protein VJX94_00670 [Stellaceae bacterium]|nr:hypothetical protein [Stellaceae bacterium]
MNGEVIGASVRRKEDFRFLTGAGNYTDDINRPGQLYAYIRRSLHAHAEIAGIDTGKAGAAPGVNAVFTGAEVLAESATPAPAVSRSSKRCSKHAPRIGGRRDRQPLHRQPYRAGRGSAFSQR